MGSLFLLLMVMLFLGQIVGRYPKRDFAIKYDSRDRKVFFWIATICTIMSIGMILISTLLIENKVNNEVAITIVIFGGFVFFPIIALVAWLGFLGSALYLRRLRNYGYEVPENKKEFGSRLDKLHKVKCSMVVATNQSKESIILAVCSVVVLIGVMINSLVFYVQHKEWGDLAYIGVQGSVPLFLFWAILTFVFWRQRLREKYRDDVEMDESRKKRKQMEEGIVEIVIYLFFTIIWLILLTNGAEYIYQARLQAGYYQ